MKLKVIITTLLLGIGILESTITYPISPRPLRKLVIESENIVYAGVIAIEHCEKDDHWNDTKAILVIKEILQGSVKQDTIDVFFSKNMICPAPAHYEVGKSVLAFVNKYKKKSGYYTHALSYGSKTMNSNAFKSYKNRILEMQKILNIENEKIQASETLDWLVTCSIDPVTRYEGIYELSPRSDFMSYYDQDKNTFTQKYQLNENQIATLRKTFFSLQEITYSDIGLIDLVTKERDQDVLDFLVYHIKKEDLEKIWYKNFFFTRIAELSDRDDLKDLASKIEKVSFLDKKAKEKTDGLVQEFISRLK